MLKEDQSFIEYTEERIATFEKIHDLFPEYAVGLNVNGFRDAYGYEDHMNKTKAQLEKFFGRKLTWYEVDGYSQYMWGFVVHQMNLPPPTNIDEDIDRRILFRKRFCEFIGLDFNEIDIEVYKNALKTAILHQQQQLINMTQRKQNDDECSH